MSTWAARASLAVAVATLFAAAVACGGDDDNGNPGESRTPDPTFVSDSETYLQNLATALASASTQPPQLEDLRQEAFGPNGNPQAAAAYGAAYEAYVQDLDAAAHGVTPSEELFSEHQALGAGTTDLQEFARLLHERLRSDPPATDAGFAAVLDELDAATATQRYRDACSSLQIYATANGIDAELGCLQ